MRVFSLSLKIWLLEFHKINELIFIIENCTDTITYLSICVGIFLFGENIRGPPFLSNKKNI